LFTSSPKWTAKCSASSHIFKTLDKPSEEGQIFKYSDVITFSMPNVVEGAVAVRVGRGTSRV
jgi:hypothetical protein